MERADLPHAGVKVPPPFIQLGFIGLGGVLEFFFPLAIVPGDWVGAGRAAGGLLVVGGVVVILAAAYRFRQAHTAIEPWKPSTTLIDRGLYAVSRNPIYLSFAVVHTGIALIVPSIWVALSVFPALLTIRYYVIAREERYLERAFGQRYLEYKNRVRRWI